MAESIKHQKSRYRKQIKKALGEITSEQVELQCQYDPLRLGEVTHQMQRRQSQEEPSVLMRSRILIP